MTRHKTASTIKGRVIILTLFLILLPLSSLAPPPQDSARRTTRAYDVYIGFAGQMDCVPAKGPYLTQLSHDLRIPGLRFVFEARTVDGTTVNWYPLLGPGPRPAVPQLVFDYAGHIDAALCPHIKCGDKIEKAWFTKQNKQFDAMFTVIPVEEHAGLMKELIDGNARPNLEQAVVNPHPFVLMVHMIAKNKFAWTGECIVRHQDCGSTADLEFYLALPYQELLQGKEVSWEFPFQTDDFDVPGVLTVRFIPAGSIK